MLEKGFKRKRYVFHRLVNKKIVQKLSYVMFSGQWEFAIQFCFEPLCCGEEIEVFMDDYRLGELTGNKSHESMDTNDPNALRETLELCRQHLFPHFYSVVDYESYYDYAIKNFKIHLDELTDTYKKAHSDYLRAPMDNAFFTTSLVTGNFGMARKSRETVIKQNEDAESKKKFNPASPWPEIIRKRKEEYALLKSAMDTNNKSYIEEYIAKNEKQALESYIRNFYGKRAFEKYQETQQLPS